MDKKSGIAEGAVLANAVLWATALAPWVWTVTLKQPLSSLRPLFLVVAPAVGCLAGGLLAGWAASFGGRWRGAMAALVGMAGALVIVAYFFPAAARTLFLSLLPVPYEEGLLIVALFAAFALGWLGGELGQRLRQR